MGKNFLEELLSWSYRWHKNTPSHSEPFNHHWSLRNWIPISLSPKTIKLLTNTKFVIKCCYWSHHSWRLNFSVNISLRGCCNHCNNAVSVCLYFEGGMWPIHLLTKARRIVITFFSIYDIQFFNGTSYKYCVWENGSSYCFLKDASLERHSFVRAVVRRMGY